MGGITDATSGKFVLMAATLLFHGRVDNARATIAIVPGARHSAVSEVLSKRLDRNAPIKIGIRAEYLRAAITAVESRPAQNADVRLGQDILDDNPIEIDFVHRQLRLLLASEAKRAERGMIAIPLTHRPDGTMTVQLKLADAAPIAALLDLTQPTDVTAATVGSGTVALGPVVFDKADVSYGTTPSVGLGVFKHARVIFDLGHGRIWVAA